MGEFHRELPCELAEDELADRARRLAQAVEVRDERDARRKDTVAALKRQVDDLTAEIRLLADVVCTRREMREVLCVSRTLDDGTVETMRTDTGEVIETLAPGPATQRPLWHDEPGE